MCDVGLLTHLEHIQSEWSYLRLERSNWTDRELYANSQAMQKHISCMSSVKSDYYSFTEIEKPKEWSLVKDMVLTSTLSVSKEHIVYNIEIW